MKTAVAIDNLFEKGGSERAVLVWARAFHADIFTTSYDPRGTFPEFANYRVFANPLRFLRPELPGRVWRSIQGALLQTQGMYKFSQTDLSDYDLVITTGQAKFIPVSKTHRRIHYEFSVKDRYRFESIFKPWALYMKQQDRKAIREIKILACNSEHIRAKIKRFYQRDAEVIYPAVKIDGFRTGRAEGYYLAVERIAPEKNIETQLEAFRMAPDQRLLVAGSPRQGHLLYFRELQRVAPPNVTFLGPVSDAELLDLYSHAKAAVQTNLDEDLGRIPIEAMASGKPCIAVNAGGFKETIVHGQTGILVEPPYSENLAKTVREFKLTDFSQDECLKRARLFSEEAHIEKLKALIEKLD